MPPLPARLHVRDAVQGMVPLSLVRVLGTYLQAQGLDPAEVLPPGLSLEGSHHLARFPAEDYCQLLLRSAQHLNDPLLGLHLGQSIQPAQLGALGYVLLACENLGAAMLRIQRYHRLIHDLNPISPQVHGDQVELQWGTSRGKPGALFDEAGITSIVQFSRGLCAQHVSLIQVDFVNPPPDDLMPYTSYFGCPVRFAQPVTRLVMPMQALQTPLRQADPTLRQLMEQQVNAALDQLPTTGDLAEMTQRVVARLAPQGIPELPQVAQELGLTPRVYYRRLAEQSLNFRDLREHALRQVAEAHLRDDRLTLAEVGMLMGYSEQSAFSRAFKRWTGLSPSQWQQGQA